MAANLVKAGFVVIGYNRAPEPVQRLVEQGGRGADASPRPCEDAEVVVTMVPDSPDVEAVALGEGRHLRPRQARARCWTWTCLDPPRRRQEGGRGRASSAASGSSTPR